MQSFQNLGLAVFNILAGYILQNYGYLILELFFLIICIGKYLIQLEYKFCY